MEWSNAEELYADIVDNPHIKRVMDFGTGIGCSAAVISLAFQKRGEKNYHIDSLEQYDKCVKLANELIPKELKENITVIKTEGKIWTTDYIPYTSFYNYKDVPGWDYELIINDGPAPWLNEDKRNYIDLPNGTITEALIDEKIKAGTLIAWDGRLTALRILERYFGDNFYLTHPAKLPNGDFNVIERKDNKLEFSDTRLKTAQQLGYFNEPKPELRKELQVSSSLKPPIPQ